MLVMYLIVHTSIICKVKPATVTFYNCTTGSGHYYGFSQPIGCYSKNKKDECIWLKCHNVNHALEQSVRSESSSSL